jgi:hypothetical protein
MVSRAGPGPPKSFRNNSAIQQGNNKDGQPDRINLIIDAGQEQPLKTDQTTIKAEQGKGSHSILFLDKTTYLTKTAFQIFI